MTAARKHPRRLVLARQGGEARQCSRRDQIASGSSSVVEHYLAKVGVASSSLVSRSSRPYGSFPGGTSCQATRAVRMRHLIADAALVVFLLAACGGSAPGRTQQQATTTAQHIAQGMSGTPVVFVSASSGRFGSFESAGDSVASPNRQVWTVVFRGTFQGSCGPSSPTPHACPPPNTTVRVILDYTTGAFIMARTPAG
jgi:hypothetical protein